MNVNEAIKVRRAYRSFDPVDISRRLPGKCVLRDNRPASPSAALRQIPDAGRRNGAAKGLRPFGR